MADSEGNQDCRLSGMRSGPLAKGFSVPVAPVAFLKIFIYIYMGKESSMPDLINECRVHVTDETPGSASVPVHLAHV